ncbi:ABC transporter ATP-binding protein [Pseudonocardia endophytica]|uniref:Putative ABC transport system ATP-binding protein n=1 Tax=Pseudonocardia endophytica TaxID=401976 RepID=A0A4R1HN11_PSEEN|nr:ABC transporter ATP-binding protein [Pseudonocardia endophytica]TCK22561.1 putative ABC transport system ATP-binding protein [Pseudonocardia endophytica]
MPDSGESPPTGATVLRGSFRAFRGRLTAASALFCGHQAGEALVPVLVGVVIDRAVGTGDPLALVFWLAVLGLDFLFLSTCYRFGARQAWFADVSADARLRMQVADRMLDPRGGAEAGRLPGTLSNIAVSDAKRIAVASFMLPLGIAAVMAVLVSTIALLTISLPLGLLILLGTPPLLWLIQKVGKPLERRSETEQERAAQASGVAADLVGGIRVLKGMGAEAAAVRRYTGVSGTALGATLRATRAEAGFLGSVRLANGLFLALIALVGGRLAAEGDLSVGGLVAAVGLAQFLVGPLEMFGAVSAQLAQARASASRIADLLNSPHAVGAGNGSGPDAPRGALALHGLDTDGIDGVDLDVPAGQLLGVVAHSPEAATGLLRVLGRETEPAGGRVTLDGVALAELTPERARSAVLVAAHDAHLFAGTVRENVLAGAPGAEPDPALTAAQADQVVEALPRGHETEIAARGSSLSGGQRQRIALARALAAEPPVLVLHDPTTAVDAVTESRIADGLAALRRDRTTIVITTSPALLAVTDRAVVLRDGRIVGDGTHAELLDDPDYRALVTG